MVTPPTLNRRSPARRRSVPAASAADNVVPYDYGATFVIDGTPGAIRQDVINVSPDGVFVAVAIGYGFEEARGRNLELTLRSRTPATGGVPVIPAAIRPADLTLGEIPPSALIEGVRVNPQFNSFVFANPGGAENATATVRGRELLEPPLPALFATRGDARRGTLFQRLRAPAEISFLFSLLDSASGRELQDEPTHNLASLGKSNGERPFRWLAQPVTFMPRSTLRLQIVERSEGVSGTLHIVLYGYKVLGATRCAEPIARAIAGQISASAEERSRPSDRVIPFDYVTTFALTGRPGNQTEAEATVSVEGGFVATSIGYGLMVEEQGVAIEWQNAADTDGRPANSTDLNEVATQRAAWNEDQRKIKAGQPAQGLPEPTVNLADFPFRLLPPSALADGLRIRPELVRLAFQDNGQLATALPVSWLDRLFERLNRVEDVSFRYSVYDSGRGRELQNQPLHNIAGLGIANGGRPFKKFARPLAFLPRSTIRVRVEEQFGRGTLFIVFQGYKLLDAPGGAR